MAINPALLVSAAMMQDYFVDNVTGQAMAAGTISMFRDDARTTFKNWYYQTGSPGAYTYLPLDNPMTLSSVGTIVDPSGQDTIPFYYPFDENDQTVVQTYYVVVVDSNGQAQFTRQNFPSHTGSGGGGVAGAAQLTNIIANNIFFNADLQQTLTAVTNGIVAPGAHEGLYAQSGTDIRFVKNTAGATDIINFPAFILGDTPFSPQETPQYPLNLKCTATMAGETFKRIQVPLNQHLQTLTSQVVTFSLWGILVSGANTLQISISQFTGSGNVSPTVVTNVGTPISLTTAWTQFSFTFVMPSASGLALSTTGDDALFLNIGFPVSALFEINIAKPFLCLGNAIPPNDFVTNDQVDSITLTPRTGDVRVSLNAFAPWGWILCNDGTIGNPASGATRAATDTWNLFYLIWTSVHSNTFAPIFTSAGAGSTYGASAYADWIANKRLSLTRQLGRAIASQGLASTGGVTTWALGEFGGAEDHTLTVNELAQHTHDPAGGSLVDTGAANIFTAGTIGAAAATTGGVTGWAGPTPFSVTQPTVFYNVFLKL